MWLLKLESFSIALPPPNPLAPKMPPRVLGVAPRPF